MLKTGIIENTVMVRGSEKKRYLELNLGAIGSPI